MNFVEDIRSLSMLFIVMCFVMFLDFLIFVFIFWLTGLREGSRVI